MSKTHTKKVSDRVLRTIKKEKITPIPKWEFILKNTSLWLLLIFVITVLITASSLSIFGVLEGTISPYFWLFIAIIFLPLAYLILVKTKGSYRLTFIQKILPIVIFSLLLGFTLFRLGTAGRLDRNLAGRFAYYRQLTPLKVEQWSRPQDGYLGGTITKVIDQNNFYITDFSGKNWHITGQNIFIRGRVQIVKGIEIKIVGQSLDTDTFQATDIRPWVHGHGF